MLLDLMATWSPRSYTTINIPPSNGWSRVSAGAERVKDSAAASMVPWPAWYESPDGFSSAVPKFVAPIAFVYPKL